MKVIKGPSGFGDSIYMRVIMEWYLKNKPDEYTILTNFNDVFYNLPIQCVPFQSNHLKIDTLFTYIHSKTSILTQFEDMTQYGGLPYIDFTSDLKNRATSNEIIVILPYDAMNGGNMARCMRPEINEFMNFVNGFQNIKFIDRPYKFIELIDMFNSAKLVISQIGWAVPLAEMLDTPLCAIFTKRTLNSHFKFINTITPKKILTKSTSYPIIMK